MAGGAVLNRSSSKTSVASADPEEAAEPQEVTPLRDSSPNVAIDPETVEINGASSTLGQKAASLNGSIVVIEKNPVNGETATEEHVLGEEDWDEIDEGCCTGGIQVDSGQSWAVALTCAWVMFWTLLINRTGRIIHDSLEAELGMSRDEAAAPFSMLGAISNIFAVVTGLLIRLTSLSRVSALGTVLTSSGILLAAGFFDRVAFRYCIGILTAIGQGLVFPTHMVAVNSYFEHHRSTASGVSYIGDSLVSFAMPLIYDALMQRFGFRITLAIVGSLTLNAMLGALVLRIPVRTERVRANSCNNNLPIAAEDKPKARLQPIRLKELWSRPQQHFSFLKRPIFYLIVASGIVFGYVLVLFNVSVVAFAKEMEYADPSITLFLYAIGDIAGRLLSGQLSDRGWMRRRTVIALGFLLASLATFGMAIFPYRGLYLACCFQFGLSMGAVMILFSVLITEYLGLTNLPLAIGIHCLVNGLTAIPRQHLVRFLSRNGSVYWPLYMFMSIASALTAIVWAVHSIFMNFRSRNDTKRRTQSDEEKTNPEEFKLAEKIRTTDEDRPENASSPGTVSD